MPLQVEFDVRVWRFGLGDWEVKQHSVTSFSRPDSGTIITLVMPEPIGGFS